LLLTACAGGDGDPVGRADGTSAAPDSTVAEIAPESVTPETVTPETGPTPTSEGTSTTLPEASTSSTTPSSTAPSSTAPSSTTVAPGTSTTSTTIAAPAIAAGALECGRPQWRPQPIGANGEITLAIGRALYAIDPATSQASCLAMLDGPASTLDWGPQADRLLVGSDTVLSADGAEPSGFQADTAGVMWSKPKGSALIAPSADGSQLLHKTVGNPNDVEDVAGLAVTWMAEYHPSGVAIIAAGIADDGRAGLFIADNHGENVKPLALLLNDPEDTITDMAVSSAGNVVTFVHDHTPGSFSPSEPAAHIHEIVLPGLNLVDVADLPAIPTGLVASRTGDAAAWMLDDPTTGPSAQFKYREPVQFQGAVAVPVGFLGDGSSLVMVRPTAKPGGPGDAWLVPVTGEPTLIARGVDAATTRVVIGEWIDLPADIEAQAPG
jgi:hypothetical protein